MLHPHDASTGCAIAAVFALAVGCAQPCLGDGGDGPASIAGPVSADIVAVRDGDTVEVDAHIWPQQTVRVAVRLRGIDAPEMKARCGAEKAAALAAKDRLAALLGGGKVQLLNVSGDKYFGRVLAEMSAGGEPDVARRLLREGLVVPYAGKARHDWCLGRQSDRGGVTASRG